MNTIEMLGRWEKQPADEQDYDVSFVQWLRRLNDTPASSNPYMVTVPSGITLLADSLNNGVVKVWLAGGTAGERYKITVRLTTQGGRVKEAEFEVIVKQV